MSALRKTGLYPIARLIVLAWIRWAMWVLGPSHYAIPELVRDRAKWERC